MFLRRVVARSLRHTSTSSLAPLSSLSVLSRRSPQPRSQFERRFSEESHDDFKPVRKAIPAEGVSGMLKKDVADNKVFLYMKGTPEQPQCGFSRQVCMILNHVGVDYQTRNVLESEEVRAGVKEFSDWPTVPQLYIAGEFIGGCDIISSMYADGELVPALKEAGALA